MKPPAIDGRAGRAAATAILLALGCVLRSTPLAAAPQPAAAVPVNESERARARQLGEAALAAYERGEWRTAYAGFEAADNVVRAPTFLLFMARSKRRLGELTRALDLYRALANLALEPDAPEQFVAAKRDGEQELAELAGRIPALVIEVKGAPSTAVRVTLDGAPLDPAALAKPVPADPGAHDLEATARGFTSARAHVKLAEAANETVSLVLEPAGDLEEPAGGGSSGSLAPAAVAFAIGGAGIVLGTVTGALAIPKVNDIRSRCLDGHCPVEDQSLADDARVLTTLSTVGFVVGAVGAATGIVLAIVRPGGEEPPSGEPGPASAVHVRVSLSPLGQFSLEGSF